MIWNSLKKSVVMSVFKLKKESNIKITKETYFSVDNDFLLSTIFKYNMEKIYEKENYPYFNGVKIVELLGEIIREDLMKDLAKTTEIYYRLVDEKKIIEFYNSESFREILIVEDVLAVIKNSLVESDIFYNTPISILHMPFFEMIKHKDFYEERVAKKEDYRLKIRNKILREYFTFLLCLNQKNNFKYDFFRNYDHDKENDIFDLSVSASSTKSMYLSVLDNIHDLNEMNALLMNEDSIYSCKVLGEEDYERFEYDLFSVGTLDTIILKKHKKIVDDTMYGFYLNKCPLINKMELISSSDRIELLFKINDLKPDLKLTQRFVIYNGSHPAKKEEVLDLS